MVYGLIIMKVDVGTITVEQAGNNVRKVGELCTLTQAGRWLSAIY